MKNMLVASDLSVRSERALRRAFSLARSHGAKLTVVHVVDEDLPPALAGRRETEAKEVLTALCESLPDAGSVDWTLRVELGDAAPSLIAASDEVDADLVVTGLHRARWFADLFGDTTAERLARVSLRPVLLVADPAETPYSSVLLGLDLSPASAAAARAALDIAPQATLHGFHAVHVPYRGLTTAGHPRASLPFVDMARGELSTWLSATGLDENLPEPAIEEGGVREVFDRQAQAFKPQLAAIGAHGRGALAPTVLGRFAAELLRDPPCDLLIVRR